RGEGPPRVVVNGDVREVESGVAERRQVNSEAYSGVAQFEVAVVEVGGVLRVDRHLRADPVPEDLRQRPRAVGGKHGVVRSGSGAVQGELLVPRVTAGEKQLVPCPERVSVGGSEGAPGSRAAAGPGVAA